MRSQGVVLGSCRLCLMVICLLDERAENFPTVLPGIRPVVVDSSAVMDQL